MISRKIINVFKDVLDIDEINLSDNVYYDLRVDSLTFIHILILVEEELQVTISDDLYSNLDESLTLEKLIENIKMNLG